MLFQRHFSFDQQHPEDLHLPTNKTIDPNDHDSLQSPTQLKDRLSYIYNEYINVKSKNMMSSSQYFTKNTLTNKGPPDFASITQKSDRKSAINLH